MPPKGNSRSRRSSGFFPADRPAVTVDCVVFGYGGDGLKLLLIQRRSPPFAGRWALPGGFVRADESLEQAALRELREETAVTDLFLEQLYTFGDPGRDPRGRVVSVAYYALVRPGAHELEAATDAVRAGWFGFRELPPLAFDHADIVAVALRRLRAKVRYEPIGFQLLPATFTLSQLQSLYEAILEQPLDKRNFRKRVLATGLLNPTGARQPSAGRSAELYQFDAAAYRRLTAEGIGFAL